MSSLLLLLSFSNLVKRTVQQNTICVWNSKAKWDHLNGEYDLQSDTTYNGYPYWKQAETSSSIDTCPETPFHIFAARSEDNHLYWTLHNVSSTQYTYGSPYCDDVYDNYPFPSDPTQCIVGYYVWEHSDSTTRAKVPLTITAGSCPTLPCDEIKISNTSYTECDQTFVADVSRNNVFVHDSMYFFFNQYTFRWGCGNDLYQWERCDGHFYVSGRKADRDEWINVSTGSSISIIWNNGNDVTMECIKTTTDDPTLQPSMFPNIPSKHPLNTISSTLIPTMDPTIDPTFNPTTVPTMYPTSYPYVYTTTRSSIHTSTTSSKPNISTSILADTTYTSDISATLSSVPIVSNDRNDKSTEAITTFISNDITANSKNTQTSTVTATSHDTNSAINDDIFDVNTTALVLESVDTSQFFVVYGSSFIAVLCCLCICIIAILCKYKKQYKSELDMNNLDIASASISQKHIQHVQQQMNIVDVHIANEISLDDTDASIEKEDDVKIEDDENKCVVLLSWLEFVELPQYYQAFIENGYASMNFIKSITDISELKQIGIESLEHQQRIFAQISLLRDHRGSIALVQMNNIEQQRRFDEEVDYHVAGFGVIQDDVHHSSEDNQNDNVLGEGEFIVQEGDIDDTGGVD